MENKIMAGFLSRRLSYILIIVSIIGLAGCFAILIPQVQRLSVDFIEQYIIHRKSYNADELMRILATYAKSGAFCIILFDLLAFTKQGRLLFSKIKEEMKACFAEIDTKVFLKAFLLLSGIYLLALSSLIRANFLYSDDLGRTIQGDIRWGWSRYIANLLSWIVHADTNLTDISPLPQILAVLIIAAAGVLLVYILNDKKITVLPLLASIPVGLSPYFLECLSYKYDAPYMALSVLASIIPFLFIRTKKAFVFSSIISLWIMCMTYQASSGIYVLIAVILSFKDWNSKQKSCKETGSFVGLAALSFCLAMLSFRFIFMTSTVGYVSTAMFPPAQLLSGILGNIKNYIILVNDDFGMIWKVCIVIICMLFILKMLATSAQKKIIVFFVSVIILPVLFLLSFGVYIALEEPLYAPRALFCLGIFLAIINISIVSNSGKINKISALALSWCFVVFAFSYGNALADQKRYTDFRAEMLLHDLSALFPNRTKDDMPVQLKNTISFAPSIKNIAKHYPVIERLVPRQLSGIWELSGTWGYFYLLEYFNWGNIELRNDPSVEEQTKDTLVDFDTLDLPVVFDSFYHTIKSDGDKILIVLKN